MARRRAPRYAPVGDGSTPAAFFDAAAPAWQTVDTLHEWCQSEGLDLTAAGGILEAGPLTRRLAAARAWCVAHGRVDERGRPAWPAELRGIGLESASQRLERFSLDLRELWRPAG